MRRRSLASLALLGALLAGCSDHSGGRAAPPTSRTGGSEGSTSSTVPEAGGGFVNAWQAGDREAWALWSEACPRPNFDTARCAVVSRTSDNGGTWTRTGTVQVGVDARFGSDYVAALHFADPQHGWLYDRSLFATFNGGKRWQPVDLGNPVAALDSSGTLAYALVGSCAPGAGDCAGPMRLFEGTVATGRWRFVTPGFDLPATDTGALIVTRSGAYALVVGRTGEPMFIARTAAGRWERRTPPCLRAIVAPVEAQDGLVAACRPASPLDPVELQTSSDGGKSWAVVWQHGFPSAVTSIAVTGQAAVVGLENGDIVRSADNGMHFSTVLRAGASPSIRFADAEHGIVLGGTPGDRRLYRTTDSGATWQPVPPPH